MLNSIALVFLSGLFFAFLIEKLHLPRIIGILLAGIILGPHVLNQFDATFLSQSSTYRQMALIIILIKAGLTINPHDLKQVGRPAILMCFLPAVFEIVAYILFTPYFTSLTVTDSALLGSVMAAVSPAVVVPRMVTLIENKIGTTKSIPQLILAGASFDDIIVIVLFSSFLNISQGNNIQIMTLLNIPLSIFLGILTGIIIGFLLHWIFNQHFFSTTYKVIIILAVAFLLSTLENQLKSTIAFSGLLAVMSLACSLKIKGDTNQTTLLATYFGQIWIAAELLLFVLVGAAVNIDYLFKAGFSAIIIILCALIFRSIGVYCCLINTRLTMKEKIFCIVAYLPKATVQAAIGAIPLTIGLESGPLILSFAVIGIIITAPIGAILIDQLAPAFLSITQ